MRRPASSDITECWQTSIWSKVSSKSKENVLMKKFAVLASLALICIALPLTLSAQADTASSIAHLEQTWAEAQKAGDAGKIAPLLAEKFINTDVDGAKSGKAKLLAGLKGGKWE